jgi:hypothetical protein
MPLLAAVVAALVITAGCAYLVTERALSPQIDADRGDDGVALKEAPWLVYIIHVRLSGDPNAVRWDDGGRTVTVRSLPLTTTSWSWGPVLPILPLFSTTSRPSNLEIDVSVGGEPGPVRARVEDFALRLPDRTEAVRPTGGVRVPANGVSELRALNPNGDTVIELKDVRSMRLSYPVDRTTLEAAELFVRVASADGAWTFERSVRFVRGSTTFVMTVP